MKSSRTFWAKLCLLIGFMASLNAHAEQKQTLGEWDVHYIVFNTTFLTPEVAKNYGIVRSRYNALVNISVLNADDKKAQNVSVSGSATNLLGTNKSLTFKKVKDGEAIYYLAVLKFDHMETYRFAIDVQRGNKKQTLRFNQKMYTDS